MTATWRPRSVRRSLNPGRPAEAYEGLRQTSGVGRWLVAVREQQVQRPTRVGEDLRGRLALRLGAGAGNLARRIRELVQQPAQVDARGVGVERRERVAPGVAMLGQLLAAGVCKGDEPAAGVGGHRHEALVLELVDRRVDRARAWAPGPAGTLRDGLHELVAVHRLLLEQQ